MTYLVHEQDSNTVIAVRYTPVAGNPREAGLEVYLHAVETLGTVLGTSSFMVVYRVSGTTYAVKKNGTRFERVKPPRSLVNILKKFEHGGTLVVEKGAEIETDSLCSKTSLGRICGPEDLEGHDTFWLKRVKGFKVDTIILDKNVYLVGRWGYIRLVSSTTGGGALIGPYGMANTNYIGYPKVAGGFELTLFEKLLEKGREFDVAAAWALYWCRLASCRARAAVAETGTVVFEADYAGRRWRLELPKEKGLHVAAALVGTVALDSRTAFEVVEYAYRVKLQPFSENVVRRLVESVEDPQSILKLASLSYHSKQLLLAIGREKLLRALVSLPPSTVNSILDVPELTAIMFNVVPELVGATGNEPDISVAEIVDSVFGHKVFYVNGVRVTAVTVREAVEKATVQARGMKQGTAP